MNDQVELARSIAQKAHAGQTYGKDSQPYFDAHVELVAQRVRDAGYHEDVVAIAYLHDVVEDTSVTLQDLIDAGVSPAVVYGVEAMTHRDGESYMQYLWRVGQNPLARVVKHCDMKQNLSCNPTARQTVKYTMGIDFLELTYPQLAY